MQCHVCVHRPMCCATLKNVTPPPNPYISEMAFSCRFQKVCVCCNSCKFFFSAVNARNKKTVRSCNFFFAVSRVSRLTRLTAKKKLHDLTVFLLRAFTAKKKITRFTAKIKKITRPDGFFVTRIYSEKKKNYTTYRKNKKITRLDDFFVHAFTAKIKKLHDLTAKKQLPILLKMHACRRCAHLWPRSGR